MLKKWQSGGLKKTKYIGDEVQTNLYSFFFQGQFFFQGYFTKREPHIVKFVMLETSMAKWGFKDE